MISNMLYITHMDNKNEWTTFDEMLRIQLKDPEFRKNYEALEPEFAIIKAMLDFRAEKGLTQRELAERTGLKQSSIARLESGRANPRVESLFRLAKGLGATLEIRFVPKS